MVKPSELAKRLPSFRLVGRLLARVSSSLSSLNRPGPLRQREDAVCATSCSALAVPRYSKFRKRRLALSLSLFLCSRANVVVWLCFSPAGLLSLIRSSSSTPKTKPRLRLLSPALFGQHHPRGCQRSDRRVKPRAHFFYFIMTWM